MKCPRITDNILTDTVIKHGTLMRIKICPSIHILDTYGYIKMYTCKDFNIDKRTIGGNGSSKGFKGLIG